MRRYRPRINDEALLRFTLAILIFGGVVAYFANSIFIAVPPGHVGVLWSRFFGGTQVNRVYKEGMHVFLPWDKVTLYDARGQHLSERIESITRDGLAISLTLDVRYHLIIDEVGSLQREIGGDYENTLLRPTVTSFVRGQIARYTAEEVYSTQRSYLERVVLDFMRLNRTLIFRAGLIGTSFLNYDAIFINQVTLPQIVQRAIEHKVEQQEVANEWKYRVQREGLESERRLIEAKASRSILDLLGSRLTDTFVRLRYVEELGRLANAPNAKMILTGPGGANTPVVLGVDAGDTSAAKPALAVPRDFAPPPMPATPSLPPEPVMPPAVAPPQ